jgi:DNA repair exonuclease SbcCD ATPase subunit
MGRRKGNAQEAVSLFPFLSILACVIGALTLMITALALGQMDTDAVASVEQYEKAKDQVESDQEVIEQLQRTIAQAESSAGDALKELKEARQELKRLEEAVQEAIQGNQPAEAPPEVDIEKLKQRIEQLEKELAERKKTQEELAEALKDKQQADEAVVRIQPGGTGQNLNPHFVECTATGIVIYQGDEPLRVRRADMKTSAEFLDLLKRVSKSEKETVVFLLRDDALATYNAARSIARSEYARNGKLPVVGHGKLDLSLFENATN